MERCPECGEPITYRAVPVVCVCKEGHEDLELDDDAGEQEDDDGD